MRELPDDSVSLTVTSPPYFNARDYSVYDCYSTYLESLQSVFSEVHRVTGEGRFLCVNISPVIEERACRQAQSKRYPIPFDLHGRLDAIGWDFLEDIIWRKPEGSAGNRNATFYQNREPLAYKPNLVTEYLLVYRKRTPRLIDWNMRRVEFQTRQESKIEGEYPRSNVWDISPERNSKHPAVFPLEIPARLIAFYSYKGETVLDPFLGSGTTGVACVNTGRNFIGMEKDAGYFAFATARIEEARRKQNEL